MMYFQKRFLIIFIAAVFFIFSVFTKAIAAPEIDEMEIVFFNPDSGSQNPVDATNALQTFCNVINRTQGWNLRAYFFKKQKDLDLFLDEHKVDLGILSQIYVVENYKKRNFVPFCIPVRNGKTTYRKVIIVRKDKTYKDLHDLKGKKLAATALGEENITFYNRVVFQGEIDVQKHFNQIQIVDSANSAIMAVLYGQVDAAAVTLASFTIMQDLNPQVKKNLMSIFNSAETPISPMVYFKDNIDPERIPLLKRILLDMHNDPTGRQSMLAFQVEAWEPTSMDEFRETERILQVPETQTKKDILSKEQREQPEEPAMSGPAIKRIQAFPTEDRSKMIFNTWIDPGESGLDNAATVLYYRIDKTKQQGIRMKAQGQNMFQAIIDLPEQRGQESKEIVHIVKPGETLGKIARKYLGSSKKYNIIAQYNNITNPNIIYIDQELRIKTGETKVTEVRYYVLAKDRTGKEIKSSEKSKFVL